MAFAADSRAREPSSRAWHPFVVLLAGHSEARARALDLLLESTGYAVLHADSSARAIELSMSVRPDAVIVAEHVNDMRGVDLCRHLTGSAQFSLATPVMVTLGEAGTRSDRLEAYSAGAWSVCAEPLDETLLLLRLHTFIRARHVGERLREGSLYDDRTGLYNLDGLLLRAREIGAGAGRRKEALACVAFAAEPSATGNAARRVDAETVDGIAEACRRNVRASDVVGRVGGGEFAILAPCTNETGARGLLGRLHNSLSGEAEPQVGNLRASICATGDARESAFGAVEMLMRAVSELRHAN